MSRRLLSIAFCAVSAPTLKSPPNADELRKAIQSEDTSQIILSATALGIDIIAVSLPIIPGGAGAILKAKNAADKVTDAAKGADKVTDIAKGADKATDASNLSNNRVEIDKVIDYAKKNDVLFL